MINNCNNIQNNEVLYQGNNGLERVGIFISDNFDQSSCETIDLTEDDSNPSDDAQVVDVVEKPVAAVLPNGFKSIQIISNESTPGKFSELLQPIGNLNVPEKSAFVGNVKTKLLGRRKCLLQMPERKQKINQEYHAVIVHEPEPKIPRPPNAFMIFANEWRKKVASRFSNESNKDISVRLGKMWRSLDRTKKEQYFVIARKADAEHKLKYPDYVYNPKEARRRKALRDSWKDKGKRPANGQNGGKSPTDWTTLQVTQNRTLLPMSNLSNMTFSMAADGYSMMETPAWSNSWYPYRHNPVPYIVPQFSETYTDDSVNNYQERMYHQSVNLQGNGARSSVLGSSRSPFNDSSEQQQTQQQQQQPVVKGPLSQLQELANVFSSPAPCNRSSENDVKEIPPSENTELKLPSTNTKLEVENTVLNNDSDSGYVTDHPHHKEGTIETVEFNKPVIDKPGVTDVLMTETNGGETFGMEPFDTNNQPDYIGMDDVFLDCSFLSSSADKPSFDSDPGCKNVLPGFQQAFGSTEIGRFSRNDFFTNPQTETAGTEKVGTDNGVDSPSTESGDYHQPVRKAGRGGKTARKPRKLKNPPKKEEPEVKRTQNSDDCYYERQNGCVNKKGRKTLNDKSDRHNDIMNEQTTYPPPFGYPSSLPTYGSQAYRDETAAPHPPTYRNQPYQGVDHSYGNQYLRPEPLFTNPYDNCQHRYGYPEYPDNGYPYMRNNYPGYSNYEYPYFRPFGFHLDYGESWSNSSSNWSGQGWIPPGQQPPGYNSWNSSNMFPFMRLDY